jgi:hypothetical protein
MLMIKITNRVVGRTILFEKLGCQGQQIFVNLYDAKASYDDNELTFAVARDSSKRVFGPMPRRLCGIEDECPPNTPDEPYHAIPVIHTQTKTFALRLGDPDSPHCDTLRGMGPMPRTGILIHIGPSSSLGCMAISEGKYGHQRFEAFVRGYLATGESQIRVVVESRHSEKTTGG